jgi:hypothetical protein
LAFSFVHDQANSLHHFGTANHDNIGIMTRRVAMGDQSQHFNANFFSMYSLVVYGAPITTTTEQLHNFDINFVHACTISRPVFALAINAAAVLQNVVYFMPVEDLETGVMMTVVMAPVTQMTHQCLLLSPRLIYEMSLTCPCVNSVYFAMSLCCQVM